jgi:hypothetical protein
MPMDAFDDILKHLGLATPVMYAAGVFWLFNWLDSKISKEAKSAIQATIKLKDVKAGEVALAFIELFDRLYSRPLLSFRAFWRSSLFTALVTAAFFLEGVFLEGPWIPHDMYHAWLAVAILQMFVFNAVSDYASLFAVREMLTRSGAHPIIGILNATAAGCLIVLLTCALRIEFRHYGAGWPISITQTDLLASRYFVLAALLVLAWLPLFVLSIISARMIGYLFWFARRTEWIFEDGTKHPLTIVGYISGALVFAITMTIQLAIRS